jgi:hypothetical protein
MPKVLIIFFCAKFSSLILCFCILCYFIPIGSTHLADESEDPFKHMVYKSCPVPSLLHVLKVLIRSKTVKWQGVLVVVSQEVFVLSGVVTRLVPFHTFLNI